MSAKNKNKVHIQKCNELSDDVKNAMEASGQSNERKIKVLLIQPPMVLNNEEIPQYHPPLGLAYIASVLRKNNYDVRILDSVILEPKPKILENGRKYIGLEGIAIKEIIQKYRPTIVGISSMFSSQANQAHYVAKLVKEGDKKIITMMGGAHPSALPEEVIKDKNVDFVVIGEGEETTLNLINYLSNSYELEKINGIAYRTANSTVIKPKRDFIKNLDDLPFPAWNLLEMKKYARLRVGHGPLVKNAPFFSMITSRGCPHNCIFCSIHAVQGYKWRARSPKNVVDEIQSLKENYGINEINFEDDNLVLDKKRLEEISDEIIERRLDISWVTPNGINIDPLDYNLLKKMKKSGCFSLSFGIEAGNEYVRNTIIRKTINVQHAKEVIKWCRDLNIWTNGFFIIGIPGENEKTFLETIDFAKELDLDSASFFVATPYPGTELLKECKEKGYIPKTLDYTKLRVSDSIIKTEDFGADELKLSLKKAYQEFGKFFINREVLNLNILRRISKIRSLNDIYFFLRLGKRFLKLI